MSNKTIIIQMQIFLKKKTITLNIDINGYSRLNGHNTLYLVRNSMY